MHNKKVTDKTVNPQTLVNITPADVSGAGYSRMGVIPIGYYKGAAAFWDLDKLANQPLVQAEQLHILGILDGREEDYDLQTLGITAGEAVGTAHTAALTVPTGEVWYINSVQTVVYGTVANSIGWNWYCSLWTDRVGALGHGQPFHGAEQDSGVGGPFTVDDEFGPIQVLFTVFNKGCMLRAPAGTVFTVIFTNRTAVGEVGNCVFRLLGFIGKTLVA